MITKESRHCINCTYCHLDLALPAWSDVTPGEPMIWRCQLNVWDTRVDEDALDEAAILTFLNAGETCEHFEREA